MGKKYRDRESERLSVQYADRYRKNRISRLVKSARDRAEERGMAFDLTAADIVVPELCPVLGIRLVWREAGGSRGFPRDNSPSIDRFDNALGYTRDNVRIISWRANAIKGDATREEIELVAAYMRGSGK